MSKRRTTTRWQPLRRLLFRRPLVTCLLICTSVWVAVLLKQHTIVQRSHHASSPGLTWPRERQRPEHLLQDRSKHSGAWRPQRRGQQEIAFDGRQWYFHGFFNDVPVRYRQGSPEPSAAHCIGGEGDRDDSNHVRSYDEDESWVFRSCRYTNLCFDTGRRDYVLVRPDGDIVDGAPSAPIAPPVALGGINPRWAAARGFDKGIWKVRWSPTLVRASDVSGYYQLPDASVLVPFHSFAAHNVGHLLWDDFYPIFTLLKMFDLLPNTVPMTDEGVGSRVGPPFLLPIRQKLFNRTLYANCDIRRNKRKQCAANFDRFWPLMGVRTKTFSTNADVRFRVLAAHRDVSATSALVCSKTAVAGLGMLTDHGFRDHGWESRHRSARDEGTDDWVPHNRGRGALFFQFRDFMIRNLIPSTATATAAAAGEGREYHHVAFNLLSSRDWDRRLNFTKQIDLLQRQSGRLAAAPGQRRVLVRGYTLWKMSLTEQVQLAARTDVFVTACGGGSMTASFLPRGAAVLVFYNTTGGLDFGGNGGNGAPAPLLQPNGEPARLDWDLLNNAGHLRVHWLPVATMDRPRDLDLLSALVQHELDILEQQ